MNKEKILNRLSLFIQEYLPFIEEENEKVEALMIRVETFFLKNLDFRILKRNGFYNPKVKDTMIDPRMTYRYIAESQRTALALIHSEISEYGYKKPNQIIKFLTKKRKFSFEITKSGVKTEGETFIIIILFIGLFLGYILR